MSFESFPIRGSMARPFCCRSRNFVTTSPLAFTDSLSGSHLIWAKSPNPVIQSCIPTKNATPRSDEIQRITLDAEAACPPAHSKGELECIWSIVDVEMADDHSQTQS
eukprot:488384_1